MPDSISKSRRSDLLSLVFTARWIRWPRVLVDRVFTPVSVVRRAGMFAPGGLFTSREEEESDDGFEHALVFFYGCSVSAAFLAEHAPYLEVCDGVLDSRPDFA